MRDLRIYVPIVSSTGAGRGKMPSQSDEAEKHTDPPTTPLPDSSSDFARTKATSDNFGTESDSVASDAFPEFHTSPQRSPEVTNSAAQALTSLPLHLTPLSLEQFEAHCETTSTHPELVDGLVVNLGEMPNELHHRTQKCWVYCFHIVHRKKGADILVYSEAQMKITPLKDALKLVQQRESKWLAATSGSSSSRGPQSTDSEGSSSSEETRATARLPDVAVGEYFSANKQLSPRSKKKVFHSDRIPLVAVEITSPTTRHVDLYFKWEEYARCGVKEYYIVDREKYCIIRGYFDENEPRYPNGDPDFELPNPRTCKKSAKLPSSFYCRQIFRGEDRVAGIFFDLLEGDGDLVKAKNLLKPVHAEDIMREEEERYTHQLEGVKQELKKSKGELKKSKGELKKSKGELKKSKEELKDRDATIKHLQEKLYEATSKHSTSGKEIGPKGRERRLPVQVFEADLAGSASGSKPNSPRAATPPDTKASKSESGSPKKKRAKK